MLCREIFGVTDYIRRRARALADLGHVVLVPESYWRLGSPVISEGMERIEEAMGASSRLDWERTVADTVAVTRSLRERPEVSGGTGIMGFCFGGGTAQATTAALTEAGEPPSVLVAYYGSQIPTLLDLADSVRVPQLHQWGTADQFIPAEGSPRSSGSRPARGRPSCGTRAPGTPSTTRARPSTTRRHRRTRGRARPAGWPRTRSEGTPAQDGSAEANSVMARATGTGWVIGAKCVAPATWTISRS